MSSAGINFGGLASGLDTKAIISALMAVERRPLAALETKKSSLSTQKKLFSDFRALLDDLQKNAKALGRTADFLKMAATSTNEDLVTVAAGNSATPGSHEVKVLSLARAQVNFSAGHADQDAAVYGTGTLLLTIDGTTHGIEIGSQGSSSLAGIAEAINAQADAQDFGVAAQVVDTGAAGNDRYQLVLRSTTAGTAGEFSLVLDNGNAALDGLVTELNTNPRLATDARFELDGVELTRTSNSITDAIPGLTLDLHAVDLTETVTITVTTDATETSKAVKEFVDAYNKVVDFVAGQNVVGQNGNAGSPLFGDGTLRSIRSSLRTLAGSLVTTGNNAYAMFTQIGITSDREGKLTFNESKFEAALGDDEQAVRALFADASAGIATRISTQLDVFTSTSDGLIKARQDGFDRLIKDTQSRIDRGEQRLVRTQAALETRFANLESLLGRLQSQGSALSSISSLTA